MTLCLLNWHRGAGYGPVGCLLLAAILAVAWPSPAAGQFLPNQPAATITADESGSFGVYLPTERTLVRGLDRAERRIAAGEYSAATAFLNDILQRDDDSFVALPNDPTRYVGLKSAARRLIAELPDEGIAAYELQQSARAAKRLETAVEAGDYEAVAEVARRMFHTSAGYEAALLVAQRELDLGNPAAAARYYQQLLDAPRARAQLGEQLPLLAVASYVAAGNPQQASAVITAWGSQARNHPSQNRGTPQRHVEVAGQQQIWSGQTVEALAMLDPALAASRGSGPAEPNWSVHRGNEARNASHPGGPPHMRPRWKSRVANHPRLESYLNNRYDSLTQAGHPLVPAGSPLAIGDVVVFKTPWTVVAVDWQSGRRIWETRAQGDSPLDGLVADLDQGDIESDMATRGHPLDQRIWSDCLASSLSSDGERVFSIRGLQYADANQRYRMGGFRAFNQQFTAMGSMTNRLAAFDLATEGKLVWEIDGRRSRNRLSGAFFLGAPLAVDDTLYVLTEIKSAVYLVALDAKTGAFLWRQSLVSLERGVHLDVQRVLAGPEPSFAEGMVVCPTATGAVVAVDLLTRSLAWAHLYPPSESEVLASGRLWPPRPANNRESVGTGFWADGPAIIANQRVVVTPRDSTNLMCLDLLTGELLWQRPRQDAVYVACVEQGVVLVVGPNEARALRLEDGQPVWKIGATNSTGEPVGRFPDDATPSGRGILSDGQYYLPMSNGAVVAVELTTGNVRLATNPAEDLMLGNLICHRGAVISQSPLSIDKFDQRSLLLERTKAALAANPDDPAALRDRGEISLTSGDSLAAGDLLKRSYEIDPNDLLTRELLAESLLSLLRADYGAYQQNVPLLESLVDDPTERFELLRIEADGLRDLGDRVAAFDVLLELADGVTPLDELVDVSSDHQVRGDRWLQDHLAELWSTATAAERNHFDEQLARRRDALDGSSTFTAWQRYLARFDRLPGADEVRVRVAGQLLDRHDHRAAELEVMRLIESAEPRARLTGAVLALDLLGDTSISGDWNHYATLVADDPLRDQTEIGGRSASAWLDRLSDARETIDLPTAAHWSEQRIAVKESPADRGRNIQNGRRSTRQPTLARRLRIEQVRHLHLGWQDFFVANDLSTVTARDSLGEDVEQIEIGVDEVNVPSRRRNDRDTVFGARLGHLLLVSLGTEIVALDTRSTVTSGAPTALWRTRLLTKPSSGRANPRVISGGGPFDAAVERKRVADAEGNVFGSIGPLTASGVVLHDGEALVCLDPISGDVLWSRRDVSAGCELFGDEQLVFAKLPLKQSALVFEMLGGRALGERPLPEGSWLLAAGRNLATVEKDGQDRPTITLTDIAAGERLSTHRYGTATRYQIDEPDAIAVVDPAGRFHRIDVVTGQLNVDQPIEPEPKLKQFFLIRDSSRLFLATGRVVARGPESRVTVSEASYPLVTGNVYAFDAQSGSPIWAAPTEIQQQGIALDQPAACPLLVFTSRAVRQGVRGAEKRLCLLCLDKETGQPLYENDELPDGPPGRFGVVAGRDNAEPEVVVHTPLVDVTLTLTDEPRPDDASAAGESQADVAQDAADGENGLWKLGGQIGKGVLRALEESLPGRQGKQDDQPAQPDDDVEVEFEALEFDAIEFDLDSNEPDGRRRHQDDD
jgi:outer membrane protein assembly factor BamB